jgi:hypothetical protein
VYSGVGLKTISTGRSIGAETGVPDDCTRALARRSNPAVRTSSGWFAAICDDGTTLPNPPVVTAAVGWIVVDPDALPNPPVMTAAAGWLARELVVRSNRPVSGGRSGAGATVGRSAAAAIGLAAIGATATGFGVSAFAATCTGRGGTGTGSAGRRGASTRIGGSVTVSMDGKVNTAIDRDRDADVFSDARVGTTASRTPKSVACTRTLSQRPVPERARGRAGMLNRASVNRTDMCRTDLK